VLSFGPRQLADGDRFSVGSALNLPLGLRSFVPEELRPAYEAWLRRTFGAAARKLGLVPREGDNLDAEAVRGQLTSVVGSIGRDPALIAEGVKLAAHWRDVPQAIRYRVLDLALLSGKPMFDRLFQDLFTETDRAPARRPDPRARQHARHQAAERGARFGARHAARRARHRVRVLRRGGPGATGPTRSASSREHKDEILKRIPSEGTTTGQAYLAYAFTASCSAEQRDEVVDYVNKNFAVMPGGARTVKQAIEGMDQCIARRKLLEPEIRSWLGKGGKPVSTAHAQR